MMTDPKAGYRLNLADFADPVALSYYWTAKVLLCRSSQTSNSFYQHFLHLLNNCSTKNHSPIKDSPFFEGQTSEEGSEWSRQSEVAVLRFISPNVRTHVFNETPQAINCVASTTWKGVLIHVIPVEETADFPTPSFTEEIQRFRTACLHRNIDKVGVIICSDGLDKNREDQISSLCQGFGLDSSYLPYHDLFNEESSSFINSYFRQVSREVGKIVTARLDSDTVEAGNLPHDEKPSNKSSVEMAAAARRRQLADAKLKKHRADCYLLVGEIGKSLLQSSSALELYRSAYNPAGQASCCEIQAATMLFWYEMSTSRQQQHQQSQPTRPPSALISEGITPSLPAPSAPAPSNDLQKDPSISITNSDSNVPKSGGSSPISSATQQWMSPSSMSALPTYLASIPHSLENAIREALNPRKSIIGSSGSSGTNPLVHGLIEKSSTLAAIQDLVSNFEGSNNKTKQLLSPSGPFVVGASGSSQSQGSPPFSGSNLVKNWTSATIYGAAASRYREASALYLRQRSQETANNNTTTGSSNLSSSGAGIGIGGSPSVWQVASLISSLNAAHLLALIKDEALSSWELVGQVMEEIVALFPSAGNEVVALQYVLLTLTAASVCLVSGSYRQATALVHQAASFVSTEAFLADSNEVVDTSGKESENTGWAKRAVIHTTLEHLLDSSRVLRLNSLTFNMDQPNRFREMSGWCGRLKESSSSSASSSSIAHRGSFIHVENLIRLMRVYTIEGLRIGLKDQMERDSHTYHHYGGVRSWLDTVSNESAEKLLTHVRKVQLSTQVLPPVRGWPALQVNYIERTRKLAEALKMPIHVIWFAYGGILALHPVLDPKSQSIAQRALGSKEATLSILNKLQNIEESSSSPAPPPSSNSLFGTVNGTDSIVGGTVGVASWVVPPSLILVAQKKKTQVGKYLKNLDSLTYSVSRRRIKKTTNNQSNEERKPSSNRQGSTSDHTTSLDTLIYTQLGGLSQHGYIPWLLSLDPKRMRRVESVAQSRRHQEVSPTGISSNVFQSYILAKSNIGSRIETDDGNFQSSSTTLAKPEPNNPKILSQSEDPILPLPLPPQDEPSDGDVLNGTPTKADPFLYQPWNDVLKPYNNQSGPPPSPIYWAVDDLHAVSVRVKNTYAIDILLDHCRMLTAGAQATFQPLTVGLPPSGDSEVNFDVLVVPKEPGPLYFIGIAYIFSRIETFQYIFKDNELMAEALFSNLETPKWNGQISRLVKQCALSQVTVVPPLPRVNTIVNFRHSHRPSRYLSQDETIVKCRFDPAVGKSTYNPPHEVFIGEECVMDIRISTTGQLDADEFQFAVVNCDNASLLESSLPTISTFSHGRLLLLGLEGVFEDVTFDWQGKGLLNNSQMLAPDLLRQISFSNDSNPSDLPGVKHGEARTFTLRFTLTAPISKLLLRIMYSSQNCGYVRTDSLPLRLASLELLTVNLFPSTSGTPGTNYRVPKWTRLFVSKQDKRSDDKILLRLEKLSGDCVTSFEVNSNSNETVVILPFSKVPLPIPWSLSTLLSKYRLKWEIRGRSGRFVAKLEKGNSKEIGNTEGTDIQQLTRPESTPVINCWTEHTCVFNGDGMFKIIQIVLKIKREEERSPSHTKEDIQIAGCKFEVINNIYPESKVYSNLQANLWQSSEYFIGGSLSAAKSFVIKNDQGTIDYHKFSITLKSSATLMLKGTVRVKGINEDIKIPLVTVS